MQYSHRVLHEDGLLHTDIIVLLLSSPILLFLEQVENDGCTNSLWQFSRAARNPDENTMNRSIKYHSSLRERLNRSMRRITNTHKKCFEDEAEKEKDSRCLVVTL